MIRAVTCLLALALVVSVGSSLHAGLGCHVTCPACHHVCKLNVEKEKVTHECWEVECKPLCIPRVHFPWECGCPPKCAKLIHVNVLKSVEYECERCSYSWTPEPAECRPCGAGMGPCEGHCGGVVAPGDPGVVQPQPPAAVAPAPPVEPLSAPEPQAGPPQKSQRFNLFDSVKFRRQRADSMKR